jgi:hypothetical protein
MSDVTVTGSVREARLPSGVLALAERLWRQAGHVDQGDHGAESVTDMLHAPLTLEPDWPAPTTPTPVGDGHVHAEVLAEDRALLDNVIDATGHRGPEAVAAAAQELRLPVCPYRRPGPSATTAETMLRSEGRAEARPEWAAGKTIVDLSTHWAGPLATRLLADAGATVIKIDPECRPDGFRDRVGLYQYLNGAKDVVDIDLRDGDGRQRFERLISDADLIVESFSRRVMGNLGYGPQQLAALAPGIASLSIRAFPAGSAEQDWLGYGPAIHAISGLALPAGATTPVPSPIAYPDLLAGLSAYGVALHLLGTPGSQADLPRHGEVSLLGAVQPLVADQVAGMHDLDGAR